MRTVRYVGAWFEGKRDGYGETTYSNGDTYKGYWKDGLYHGEGVSVAKDLELGSVSMREM